MVVFPEKRRGVGFNVVANGNDEVTREKSRAAHENGPTT